MREDSRQPGTRPAAQGLQTRLMVQVHPNAHRNEIKGFAGEVLHIRIAAPPVEGKANKELIQFLSELLGIGKSSITIEKGAGSRKKVIIIEEMGRSSVMAALGLPEP